MRSPLLTTALCTVLIATSTPALTQPIWKKISPSTSGGGGGAGANCYYSTATSCGDGYDLMPGIHRSSSASHSICCTSDTPGDADPDAFNFDTGALQFSQGEVWQSPIAQVTGITVAGVAVSTGTEYRVCQDSSCSVVFANWTSSNNTISNNQYLQVRSTKQTASDNTETFSISVGTFTDVWQMNLEPDVWLVFGLGSFQNGNLGGAAGADSLCQADKGSLPGTFRAWVSDSSSSPSTRFENWGLIRHYEDVNGNRIASNVTTSMPSTLEYSGGIEAQASGGIYSALHRVYSQTNIDGTLLYGSNGCNSFTSNSTGINSRMGRARTNTSGWYDNTTSNCSSNGVIYCFQTAK